jgi:hypothetical protein
METAITLTVAGTVSKYLCRLGAESREIRMWERGAIRVRGRDTGTEVQKPRNRTEVRRLAWYSHGEG